MNTKTTVGIIFGGASPEHDVSWSSARYVLNALDRERHDPVLIGIDRHGVWRLIGQSQLQADPSCRDAVLAQGLPMVLLPGCKGALLYPDWAAAHRDLPRRIDVVFPVVHGPGGEDGRLQGCLEMAAVAYVGSGVSGSAVCMDKTLCRRLLQEAGLPVLPSLRLGPGDATDYRQACLQLGAEALMIKPAGQGSSVGISRAGSAVEYSTALTLARSFGQVVMIEPALARPRELEIGMLELAGGQALWSAVAEIQVDARHAFYSYEAKYHDPHAVSVQLPARLDAALADRIQTLAEQAVQALGCEGLARIDFFLTDQGGAGEGAGGLYLNEINTMPGLTSHSLFPMMWRDRGYTDDRVVAMLLDQARRRQAVTAAGVSIPPGAVRWQAAAMGA